ncbi:antibiotic biosynthesis monooxygenase [Oceanimonas baumannii]|uniref:putative quinol monooxygenase n=1 Tax=Oceanimonas baumannii TaxID=129578 RepID=UPI001D17E783|nr:antibiotic biosynthesis monooxygenase [Oceanimonas baumannii]MCC4263955.1 antibiotic biosynthesis monooxygenase [Oceanimonas baumannii]
MFIVIYEFEIRPGTEPEFRQAWLEVTQAIYQHCGSFGSRLHTSEQANMLVGYAQWPSRAQWEKDHQLAEPPYQAARNTMRRCLIQSRVVHKLEVCDDYLQPGPALTR